MSPLVLTGAAASNVNLGTNGTISGLAVGGVPDGTIDADALASSAVTAGKLASGVGGKILQVQYQRITTQASTTGSSDVDTGTTIDITPSATSSKVLVIVSGATYTYQDGGGDTLGVYKIIRDSTMIHEWYHGIYESSDTNNLSHKTGTTAHVLDSPSSTSALTYKIQMKKIWGDGIFWAYNSLPSTITVMEVGS